MAPNPRSVEIDEIPAEPESHSWTFADLRPQRPVIVVRRAA